MLGIGGPPVCASAILFHMFLYVSVLPLGRPDCPGETYQKRHHPANSLQQNTLQR